MKEVEWLECSDPFRLLDYVSFRRKANATANERSQRKLRLFAVACCFGVWKWMTDERSRRGVETAERQADGLVSEQELQIARNQAAEANDLLVGKSTYLSEVARAAWWALHEPEFLWVADVVRSAIRFSISDKVDGYRSSLEADSEMVSIATLREDARQLHLLRDIFGNPFRRVTIELRWQTSTVVDLASAIYDERNFDRMPILANALVDAGCDSQEIISHCRNEGQHVRGCWVIDSLTARS